MLKAHKNKIDLYIHIIELSGAVKNAYFHVDALTIRSKNPLLERGGNFAPLTGNYFCGDSLKS